jgi:trimethylamine--corrinoid protein Co-methyltransferase
MDRNGTARRSRARRTAPATTASYVHLTNPFVPQAAFSADEIAAIHDGALRVLQELGIRILLDEARQILQRNGALVDEATMMVRLGRDMVEQALATAPRAIRLRAANPAREQDYRPGALLFMAGAGCPNAFDREL